MTSTSCWLNWVSKRKLRCLRCLRCLRGPEPNAPGRISFLPRQGLRREPSSKSAFLPLNVSAYFFRRVTGLRRSARQQRGR